MTASNPLRTLDSFELLKLGNASVTVGGLAAGVLIVLAGVFAARLTLGGVAALAGAGRRQRRLVCTSSRRWPVTGW